MISGAKYLILKRCDRIINVAGNQMVLLSCWLRCQQSASRKSKAQNWIDSLRIYCRGGAGGTGLPSYGGVGGRGGDVWVVGSEKVKDLKRVRKENLKQRFIAEPGGNSSKLKIVGEVGKDVEVRSPVGVSVVSDEGKVIGELLKEGDRVLVTSGGQGGNKSTNFLGLRGQARSVKLDLKLLADVGLVGFPNAGKSTLLKAISRAKPKIASYPFTTIQPNLGIVQYEDLRTITVADLPGLIEGASYNVGMGHKFLKHVERTRLLLFVVDVHGFQFKPTSPHRSALETLLLLNKELELYKPDLLTKPAMLALTKMDLPGSEERREEVEKGLKEILEKGPRASGLPDDLLPTSLCQINQTIAISAKFSQTSVGVGQKAMRHWVDESEEASRLEMEMVKGSSKEVELVRRVEEAHRRPAGETIY